MPAEPPSHTFSKSARPYTLVTSEFVGTAGSFVGYHLALLIGIVGYGALLVAVIGALAVLWGWRTVR